MEISNGVTENSKKTVVYCPSRYNVFVDYPADNARIAFNCVSGGLLVLDEANIRKVDKILANPETHLDKNETEIKDNLVENRFLVEEELDELKVLKMRNSLARYNPNNLALVIAPTLRCNMACPYCYVDREKNAIDRNTINALKRFVEKKVDKAESISVSITGGEPLLEIDTVTELNAFFRDICSENKIEAKLSLVSNGLLLTPDYVEQLKSSGLESVQVTLDGTAEFHNRYRLTIGGKGTYDTILKNVAHASVHGMKIVLRANIDKSNYENIYRLIDEIAVSGAALENIFFAPSKISLHDDTQNASASCDPYSVEEFARLETKLLFYAIKKGLQMSKSRITVRFSFCGANTVPLRVIDSHGNILKCWCNLGRADANMVGKLNADGTVDTKNVNLVSRWLCWDPFEIPECRECPVLPLCMGGCMYSNIMDNHTTIGRGCTELRYNLEDILKLVYLGSVKTPLQLKNIKEL